MSTLIGYARVSTTEQDPALQLDALEKAGCKPIFQETASGARTDRPELKRALDYLRSGDTLCVWRLDRLGRSMQHLIATINDLNARGVQFRSLSEGMDTSTANGRLLFHIIGALAEFERELIRERTVAGLAAARARGRTGGRPTKMSTARIKQMKRMLDDGASITEIAAVMNVGRATVYRAMEETHARAA